jgi:hypothetical protein
LFNRRQSQREDCLQESTLPTKPYFTNLSPNELSEVSADELGRGGFCFLVAELLAEKYRSNAIFRLTDGLRKRFSHVWIEANGKPVDIYGFRSVAEMRRDYEDVSCNKEDAVAAQIVREHFYRFYSVDQLRVVRDKLRAFIESERDRSPRCPLIWL